MPTSYDKHAKSTRVIHACAELAITVGHRTFSEQNWNIPIKINLPGQFVRPRGGSHHFVWVLIIDHRFSNGSHFFVESIDGTWHLQTTSSQCYKMRFECEWGGGVSGHVPSNLGMGGHVVWANLKPYRQLCMMCSGLPLCLVCVQNLPTALPPPPPQFASSKL